jgi:hypothetical protein
MPGEFHEPRSSTHNGPCQSLNAANPVVVVPSRFHFTVMSPTVDLGNARRVAMSLTDFLLIWQPITSPHLKSLSSPDLPMLLILLSNEQHSFLPPFIPVSAVVVTSRLQFTIIEGCPDTFDQTVYVIMSQSENYIITFRLHFPVFVTY